MSARWRQAVDASPIYRDPRGTGHDGKASDRSCRQLLERLAWKSDHRLHSGLVLGWTQEQMAGDMGVSRRTVQRAQQRLERDGYYVPIIRGSSCGAPGERRRSIPSVGLVTPVPALGSNVAPFDYSEHERLVAAVLLQMTTRKRRPVAIASPLARRLGLWLQGQLHTDQKASVETPESVSGETRKRHSDALLRRTKSTYQVQAPTSPPEPVQDESGLPRDSDESLATDNGPQRRDRAFIEREYEANRQAQLQALEAMMREQGLAV